MPRKKVVPIEETEQDAVVTAPELADAPETTEQAPATAEEAIPAKGMEEPVPAEVTEEPTPESMPTPDAASEPVPDAVAEPIDVEITPAELQDPPMESESVLGEAEANAQSTPSVSDRQAFFGLDFNELDQDLTTEERQEWNSIYASYRGRSALSGTIIGVDPHSISIRNRETGEIERHKMYCAIVVPYRVRIVIPSTEMWEPGQEKPDFVLQNMVGANIDFIITKVDRENGFAIASRRMAMRAQRRFFSLRSSLHRVGTHLKCRILAVGPRRCSVECYGHDIDLTQRDIRYTAIPDLRNEYQPGQELECVVKRYDPEKEKLTISVKETEPNPFDGAELRHPVGCRRQAKISGKYGGGVFCNLPDGTVCMCNYSYQHDDSDFTVGDTVILVVQRYEFEKKQMYGKILSKR